MTNRQQSDLYTGTCSAKKAPSRFKPNQDGKHIYITTHLNILPSLLQVTLKIDEKEVDYALQDKTLLSSILQEGMPTTS